MFETISSEAHEVWVEHLRRRTHWGTTLIGGIKADGVVATVPSSADAAADWTASVNVTAAREASLVLEKTVPGNVRRRC